MVAFGNFVAAALGDELTIRESLPNDLQLTRRGLQEQPSQKESDQEEVAATSRRPETSQNT